MSKGGRISWLGLTVLAVGCNNQKPGGGDIDETETAGDGDGDVDTDTGPIPDNGIPLELEHAWFDSTGGYLILRFSEPMAPVDGVDPTDFRVSFTETWRSHYAGYIYAYTYYWDPHYALVYDPYYYQYNRLVAEAIGNGNAATDIVLRFAEPLDPSACVNYAEAEEWAEEYDAEPNFQVRVGLFPHYSPGAVPVQSADGESLAAIGPDWVEYLGPYTQTEEFGWPNLDPRVPIPCTVGVDP